jgi:hypothetical protein
VQCLLFFNFIYTSIYNQALTSLITFRNPPYMTQVEAIAQQLGISTVQLAGYLEISPSFLHMAIKGHRSLPSKSFATLLAIQQQLIQNPAPTEQPLSATAKKQLSKKLNRLMYRYVKAERHLQQLRQRHQQLLTLMHWVQHRLQTTEPLSKGQRLWLELQQATCRKRMQRCGPEHLLLAEAQLQSVAGQVSVLQIVLDNQ